MTSLPGPFGIGDFGPSAYRWIDTLAVAGQRWWQLLPVGPTGYGDSPDQSLSTLAGNLNLLNSELLAAEGLAPKAKVAACERPKGPIHYAAVIETKRTLIATAVRRFQVGDAPALRAPFQEFCRQEAHWLDDFALFAALKDDHGGQAWWEWDKPLAHRDPTALRQAADKLADQIDAQRFGQFLFARQFLAVRQYAHDRGVRLLGDLPIYVAEDSADQLTAPWEYAKLNMARGRASAARHPYLRLAARSLRAS